MAADNEHDVKGPLGEICAYFETVAYSTRQEHFCCALCLVSSAKIRHRYSRKNTCRESQVLGNKNLGEHLNDVFADRDRMLQAPVGV